MALLQRLTFRKLGASVFGAHLFFGVLAVAIAPLVGSNDWWWLAPFGIVSVATLGYYVYRALASEPARILYETGLFLSISFGVYFAFGPLLFVAGPAEAARYARSWYPVDAAESVWLTGLNFIGFGLAGLAYTGSRFSLLGNIADIAARFWGRVSPVRVFIVFLVIGLIAKYLFVLPYELRLTEDVPSGVVRQLSRLLAAAVLVGWAYKDVGPWWMGVLAKLLVLMEVGTGLLMFNKTEVLVAIFAAGLGNYFGGHRFRALLLTAMTGFLVYVLISPVVTFGRNELTYLGNGEPAPVNLSKRFEIAASYLTAGDPNRRQEEMSGWWWSRLNYLAPQQAAVSLYDQSRGSNVLDRVAWIFVPRLLFPDKPIMSNAGVDLTEKVTGLRHSSTGIGIFVDGYYILGWIGVFLTSITYGLALRAYSVIARAVVVSRAVVMYPLIFMGIFAGLRADGWWLTDVAGPMVFVLVLLGIFRFFAKT